MDKWKQVIKIAVTIMPMLIIGIDFFVRSSDINRLNYADAGLIINEVMTDNLSTIQNEQGIYADWLELYNASDGELLLGNYYLSDDQSELTKWKFPDQTIGAKEYLLIFCDKMNTGSEQYLHTNFGLDSRKESIYLSDSDGNLIDKIRLKDQECNISYGRINGTTALEGYLPYSTPGYANPGKLRGRQEEAALSEAVRFSVSGGLYDREIELELSCDSKDAVILYTLDGSEPDIHSNIYRNPICIKNEKKPNQYTTQKCVMDSEEFNNADVSYGVNEVCKAAVVRARVLKDGRLSEDIQTNTYFIDTEYSLAMVSLTTNPDNLFDKKNGNYVLGSSYYTAKKYQIDNIELGNYSISDDIDGNIEIYQGQDCIINSSVTFTLAGSASRLVNIQKSFNVKMDQGIINGKYFNTEDKYQYDCFTLRGTGSAAVDQHLYGYTSSFSTNLIQSLDVGAQSGVPCILFIDGEYWGIYFLTEPKGKAYIEQHYDIAKKEIEIVKPYEYITTSEFDTLYEQIASKDFSDDSTYDWIQTQIDVDNYMQFVIAEAYFGNTDGLKCGDHNFYLWKESGGKWKWQAFDFDASFVDGDNYFRNLRDFCFNGEGEDKKNFSIFLFQKLWQSSRFR
ncbi:MAG: CotH kinase family protein, partial [Lachnospiraceae bacterium]|nr:CotH kinase family protein [Lachnospiraceae bacterium]